MVQYGERYKKGGFFLQITFEDIKNNPEVQTYLQRGNDALGVIGYTEHGFAHAGLCAAKAAEILQILGYDQRTVTLARMAGYMHDMGNCINRDDHAQTGAMMAFQILKGMGMAPADIAEIICAIGNHDEHTGTAVTPVSAALILADKSDVRRSRVRAASTVTTDIHDRVNYAVYTSSLEVDSQRRAIVLALKIDTAISAVMDYFEIFMTRMLMCRKAAAFLKLDFQLKINDTQLL